MVRGEIHECRALPPSAAGKGTSLRMDRGGDMSQLCHMVATSSLGKTMMLGAVKRHASVWGLADSLMFIHSASTFPSVYTYDMSFNCRNILSPKARQWYGTQLAADRSKFNTAWLDVTMLVTVPN